MEHARPRYGPSREITFRNLKDASEELPHVCRVGSGLHWSYKYSTAGSTAGNDPCRGPILRYGGRGDQMNRLVHVIPSLNVRGPLIYTVIFHRPCFVNNLPLDSIFLP